MTTLTNPFEEIDQRLQDIEAKLQLLVEKPDTLPPTTETYLTTDQVCEMLTVSRVTLWNWQKAGIINSFKVGNLKRYKLSSIQQLGEEGQK